MKKYLRLFLISIITTISFEACNYSSTNNNKSTTNEKKEQTQDTIINKRDVAEVIFTEDYIMKIENIYNGEVVNDLIVTSYKYETENEEDTIDDADKEVKFSFILKGDFNAVGQIMIDKVSGELIVQFDKKHNPHKNIILDINENQKQLIDLCHFRNQEDLLLALTKEEIKKLETDVELKLTLKVNDTKVDSDSDKKAGVRVRFVEIIR